MATGADGPTVAVASSRGREPFPPTWDGSEPGTEFPVFEKNVRLWEFESELESKKRGARLLRSLSGVARAVADSLEFEEIASEKGVENILSKLKGHFSPHLEVSLPRAFERAIYGVPRGHKESIQEYLIRSERAFYLLEKEKLSLPSVAVGYVIYRQASLTEGQELRFSTWSKGNYERENVVACLRKLDKVMPEHRTKGAATFLLDDAEMPEEAFDLAGDETDDGEQYIFIEEDEAEKIFEESEVQVALATYQEIRKAINANQKNRQFYGGKGRGGGRGPSWFKPGLQGKRKIHIEELKLRTRCGRCGLVGHWARECTNQPDARCKQFAAATSKSSAASAAPSAASAKTSSSMASQQSWYVSTGDAEVFDVSFCFMCGGKHTGCNNFHVHDGESLENQDEIYGVHELKGFRHFVSPPVESSCGVQKPWQLNEVWFVGLTTCPTLAVVDTAAQDGLIGSVALERLKGRLAELGLQVVQTQKQARAHGVGGAAKVLGIVAVPLGIAQTSGVLEVTVVEGEIPLLLPIKMLQQLHALIDLPRSCLHFDKLQKTVPLCKLPSGHIAIDILDFGEEGFVYPCDASEAGYGESDFRLNVGPTTAQAGCVMFLQSPTQVPAPHGGSVALSSCLQSRRNCSGIFRERGHGEPQFETSHQKLARAVGQGGVATTADWARGLCAWLAPVTGLSSEGLFAPVLRAARRAHQDSSEAATYEVQGESRPGSGDVRASCRPSADWCQSARSLGELPGLSPTLGTSQAEQQQGDKATEEHSSKLSKGEIQRGEDAGRSYGESSTRGEESLEDRVGTGDESPARLNTDAVGATGGNKTGDDAAHTAKGGGIPDRDARSKEEFPRVAEEGRDGRSDDERVCQHGDWQRLSREEGLSRWRDGDVCHQAAREGAGDQEVRTGGDGDCRGEGQGRSGKEFGCQEEEQVPSKEQGTWARVKGATKLRKLRSSGHLEVKEVWMVEGQKMFLADKVDEELLEENEDVLVRVDWTRRGKMEFEVEEVEETALPKKVKTQLRKSLKEEEQAQEQIQETMAVAVSEVFSPPRFVQEARTQKLEVGGSYDLETGYDLGTKEGLTRMWRELEEDDPDLTCCSPPCKPFSILQELNFPKMDRDKAIAMVGEGLQHFSTSIEVCLWQYHRGKVFLLEHPFLSRAWKEEEAQKLMSLPGVWVCRTDMCEYGLMVGKSGKLNQKPTLWITNSWWIAVELQRRCQGGHEHEPLMGGKAVLATSTLQGGHQGAEETPEDDWRSAVKSNP